MSSDRAGTEAVGPACGERSDNPSATRKTATSLDHASQATGAESVETAAHGARGTKGTKPTVRALAITCSDSVSQGLARDGSGPVVVQSLAELGFHVDSIVIPDERDQIAASMRAAVADGVRVVVATGGTGLGPRDVTPEALTAVCEREIPGFGEAFRAASRGRVPLADLSRSSAGTLGDAVIVALPGSGGGARDGMAVIGPLIHHALDMMSGQGHSHGHGPSQHKLGDSGHSGERSGHPPGHSGHPLGHGQRVVETCRVTVAIVTDESIDPGQLSESVTDPTAGAIVDFSGRVRNHDEDRDVTELMYEAHPEAPAVLAEVLAEGSCLPGVVRVAAAHRVGKLQVGDLAFAVSVSAPHRSEAFAAASWLVDEIKDRLPVWKLQTFADGDKEWVNCA
jgi:molybdenum cofactor synthesis domain-containing protein